MPANLPAEARAKWIKVMEARTIEEKIKALEEFISSVPKHKGTENLLLWAKRRLRQLREEAEERKRRGRGGGGPRFFIEKEGDAQAVLLGAPNSGKTSILAKLTNAKVEIKDYPFSTTKPTPGMLVYNGIKIQIVDTPSIPIESKTSSRLTSRVIGLARNADCLLIVIDASRKPLKQLLRIVKLLRDYGIVIRKPTFRISIEKTSSGGINIVLNGEIIDGNLEDVKKLLREYKIHHAVVKIWGKVRIDQIEEFILGRTCYKPSIIILNKVDAVENPEELAEVEDLCRKARLRIIKSSAIKGYGLSRIGEYIVNELELIRVYTREPNGKVADEPLVLKKGATVLDVAKSIHSELAENFKYARVWGKSVKYGGQKVGADHVLEDGDIVEIHA